MFRCWENGRYSPNDAQKAVEAYETILKGEGRHPICVTLDISEITDVPNGVGWRTMSSVERVEMGASRRAATRRVSELTVIGGPLALREWLTKGTDWTWKPRFELGANPLIKPVTTTGALRSTWVKLTVPLTDESPLSTTTACNDGMSALCPGVF